MAQSWTRGVCCAVVVVAAGFLTSRVQSQELLRRSSICFRIPRRCFRPALELKRNFRVSVTSSNCYSA